MSCMFKKLKIKDVVLVEPKIFHDDRGFFVETYKKSEFVLNGITEEFVQDNHSFSQKGVLRGLHFQTNPKAQGKLVRVIKGKVWDVAVDMRKDSPTFKQWVAEELSEDNHRMFYLPAGFAHGFVALSDNVHLTYKCTGEYSSENDAGVIWNDPELAINWPIKDLILSDKDKMLPLFKDAKYF